MRAIGRFLWRFMVIFSFIVNVVLVIALLIAGLLIFEIKNQIAQPLVEGLHSSFVGLDQATIDWTIPVRDQIQVKLDIPLNTTTTVILQEPVPLQVVARIDLPGINAYNVAANVNLELPVGLELPVALNLDVAVDQPLDVELDVRAVIPLSQTQLHDVANNLRFQLEPLAIALNNLPNNFGEAFDLVGQVLRGEADLLAENDYSRQPWRGYSITAGVGYDLYDEPVPQNNIAIRTGIVSVGGMPALDEQVRPDVWGQGGPLAVIERAEQNMALMGIDPIYWRDGLGSLLRQDTRSEPQETPFVPETGESEALPNVEPTEAPNSEDQGIFSSGG
jgi:hypothetical protein